MDIEERSLTSLTQELKKAATLAENCSRYYEEGMNGYSKVDLFQHTSQALSLIQQIWENHLSEEITTQVFTPAEWETTINNLSKVAASVQEKTQNSTFFKNFFLSKSETSEKIKHAKIKISTIGKTKIGLDDPNQLKVFGFKDPKSVLYQQSNSELVLVQNKKFLYKKDASSLGIIAQIKYLKRANAYFLITSRGGLWRKDINSRDPVNCLPFKNDHQFQLNTFYWQNYLEISEIKNRIFLVKNKNQLVVYNPKTSKIELKQPIVDNYTIISLKLLGPKHDYLLCYSAIIHQFGSIRRPMSLALLDLSRKSGHLVVKQIKFDSHCIAGFGMLIQARSFLSVCPAGKFVFLEMRQPKSDIPMEASQIMVFAISLGERGIHMVTDKVLSLKETRHIFLDSIYCYGYLNPRYVLLIGMGKDRGGGFYLIGFDLETQSLDVLRRLQNHLGAYRYCWSALGNGFYYKGYSKAIKKAEIKL